MTPTIARTLALISTAAIVAIAPAATHAKLLVAPGPWPAPVVDATNP